MASIIEKRLSLHRSLIAWQQEIEALQDENKQLQALASMGTAVHMIAHEVNNILTPVTSYASLALDNPQDKALTEKALRKVVANCRKTTKVMDALLSMATGKAQPKQTVNLKELVEDVFSCLCRDFSKDSITVRLNIPEDMTVTVIVVQFQQVIMNLVLNAREAMLNKGGSLTVTATEDEESVHIEVSDTGYGIEKSNLDRIFESYFTTKSAPDEHRSSCGSKASGFGVGLALCSRVVRDHNGIISVESEPSKGTTFKITLPREQQPGNS